MQPSPIQPGLQRARAHFHAFAAPLILETEIPRVPVEEGGAHENLGSGDIKLREPRPLTEARASPDFSPKGRAHMQALLN